MKLEDALLSKAVDKAMKKAGLIQKKKGTFRNESGKELTHNFLEFAELAKKDGFTIIAIKETYENVYCTLNGFKVQFPKCTEGVKGFYGFVKRSLEMSKFLEKEV
jgi:hypothetical protein